MRVMDHVFSGDSKKIDGKFLERRFSIQKTFISDRDTP
jgi:hypothetical protein